MRFIGTHFQTIDSKGRIVLPARFRRLLTPADEDKLVLMEGYERCLALHPYGEWSRVLEELDARPRGEDKRDGVRGIGEETSELELDANGRVTVPREFLQLVGIEREVVLVGQLRYIELWARAAFEQHRERRRQASRAILNEIL